MSYGLKLRVGTWPPSTLCLAFPCPPSSRELESTLDQASLYILGSSRPLDPSPRAGRGALGRKVIESSPRLYKGFGGLWLPVSTLLITKRREILLSTVRGWAKMPGTERPSECLGGPPQDDDSCAAMHPALRPAGAGARAATCRGASSSWPGTCPRTRAAPGNA